VLIETASYAPPSAGSCAASRLREFCETDPASDVGSFPRLMVMASVVKKRRHDARESVTVDDRRYASATDASVPDFRSDMGHRAFGRERCDLRSGRVCLRRNQP
jgi:hypothetical protein